MIRLGQLTIEFHNLWKLESSLGFALTYLPVARLFTINFLILGISIYYGDRVNFLREQMRKNYFSGKS